MHTLLISTKSSYEKHLPVGLWGLQSKSSFVLELIFFFSTSIEILKLFFLVSFKCTGFAPTRLIKGSKLKYPGSSTITSSP